FAYGTIAKKEEKGENKGEGKGEEAGEELSRLSAAKPKQANVFLAEKERIDLDFNTYPSKATFRQSNDSREFVKGEDEEQQISYIKKGNIMHGIFSEMRTADDLPKVMKSYVERGLLADAPITPEAITSLMSSRLACRQAADWFAPGWRLYNECTILTRDPNDPNKMKEYRPDRVMERNGRFVVVDFKFASPTDEHKQQVGLYMAMLKQMGHNDVEGYLWYVYPNRVVKC
uniref:PD-(D/E)XK nuclease family protein n=1 Tax=Prevotella sp. TaxID=59823 RepID=UPI004027E554